MSPTSRHVRVLNHDSVHDWNRHCRSLANVNPATLIDTDDDVTCKWCLRMPARLPQVDGEPGDPGGMLALGPIRVKKRQQRPAGPPPLPPELRFSAVLRAQALDLLRVAFALEEQGM